MRKVLSVLVAALVAAAIAFAQDAPAAKEKSEKKMDCCKEAKGGKTECCKETKGEKMECCKEMKGSEEGCAMKSGEKMKHKGTQKTMKQAPKAAPKEAK